METDDSVSYSKIHATCETYTQSLVSSHISVHSILMSTCNLCL